MNELYLRLLNKIDRDSLIEHLRACGWVQSNIHAQGAKVSRGAVFVGGQDFYGEPLEIWLPAAESRHWEAALASALSLLLAVDEQRTLNWVVERISGLRVTAPLNHQWYLTATEDDGSRWVSLEEADRFAESVRGIMPRGEYVIDTEEGERLVSVTAAQLSGALHALQVEPDDYIQHDTGAAIMAVEVMRLQHELKQATAERNAVNAAALHLREVLTDLLNLLDIDPADLDDYEDDEIISTSVISARSLRRLWANLK